MGFLLALGAAHGRAELVVIIPGATGAALWMLRLDGWQRIFVALLTALLLASTPYQAGIPPWVRFGLAAVLTWWTYYVYGFSLHRSRPSPWFRRLWIALLFFAGASSVWSPFPGLVLTEWAGGILMLGPPITAALCRWRDRGLLRGDLNVMYVVLTTFLLLGLLDGTTVGDQTRLAGLFTNPNTYSWVGLLALSVGFAVQKERWKPLIIATNVVLGLAVLKTGSDVAPVAILVLVFGWASSTRLFVRSGLRYVLYFAVTAALTIATFEAVTTWDSQGLLNGGTVERAIAGRGLGWTEVVNLWERRPLLGYGFGSGEAVLAGEHASASGMFAFDSAHSSILQSLLELGLVGTLLLTALIGYPLVFIWAKPVDSMTYRRAHRVVVAGILVMIGESSLFGLGSAFPLAFWSAVCALWFADDQHSAERTEHLERGHDGSRDHRQR